MTRRTITMYRDGRMTVPATARKALRLDGAAEFTYEVVDDGLLLHPVVSIPREDAWAYTPEHRASVERALREPGFSLSEEDLIAVMESDDPQRAAQELIAKHRRA